MTYELDVKILAVRIH